MLLGISVNLGQNINKEKCYISHEFRVVQILLEPAGKCYFVLIAIFIPFMKGYG